MLKFLQNHELRMRKLKGSLKEDIELDDYIQGQKMVIEKTPFPHFVVDNFFKEEYYQSLCKDFQVIFDRGLSEVRDRNKFHPFLELKGELAYDGYSYPLWPGENKSTDLFFSVEWNMFISKLCKTKTSLCTSLSYHYHPPGDRTGFVHSDDVEKGFLRNDELPTGVFFREYDQTKFKPKNPFVFTEYRRIALLYYLNNTWEEGDGGETGIYASIKGPLAKSVEPKNNRLFAFEISDKSFHAFQQNKTSRSSIIQWFYVPEMVTKNIS